MDAKNLLKRVNEYGSDPFASPYTCTKTQTYSNAEWEANFILKDGQTNSWTIK